MVEPRLASAVAFLLFVLMFGVTAVLLGCRDGRGSRDARLAAPSSTGCLLAISILTCRCCGC